MTALDLHAIAPEIALSATLLVILVVDLFLQDKHKIWNSMLAITGVGIALVLTFSLVGDHRVTFNGMFVVDSFALLFKVLFLAVAALVILLSAHYLTESAREAQGEFYLLVLSSFLGMLLMASSRDLIMLFVSLELVSAPGFLVAGFKKRDARSNEAAVKFFLFGVLSTAVMLFGMSMIYGITHTTDLVQIGTALAHPIAKTQPMIVASILFIVVGFGFKVESSNRQCLCRL